MPNQPKTPLKRVRVDDDLWDRFGEMAKPNRSATMRALMRWWLREPGAKLPKRPERRPPGHDAAPASTDGP